MADAATEAFLAHRNLLFTAAYELLGSAADAEDVLQETWLRCDDGRISGLYIVRNPEKLSHIQQETRLTTSSSG
jgi:hypothetical protein